MLDRRHAQWGRFFGHDKLDYHPAAAKLALKRKMEPLITARQAKQQLCEIFGVHEPEYRKVLAPICRVWSGERPAKRLCPATHDS